jgi:S-DNA-T family DNA segregation ATPase FtsK/SpoIIIE
MLFHRSSSKAAKGVGSATNPEDATGAAGDDSGTAAGDDSGTAAVDSGTAADDGGTVVSGVAEAHAGSGVGDGVDGVDNGMFVKDVPFEIKDDGGAGHSEDEGEAADKDEGPELVIEENDEPDFLKDIPKGSLDTLFDPRLDLPNYKAPGVELLNDYSNKIHKVPHEELERNNKKIVKTLNDYKISVERIFARTGPTVTLYEIVPSAGVRISQIKRLEDDIALSLAARGVRIIAPIPGSNTVGIEVANSRPSIVPMKSLLEDPKFRNADFDLPVVIGRTISNEPMVFDLARMPHLLVAGATGQGKSVGLNAIITSLLYTKHPSEMKMVLIDPKKVELSLYSVIERHFLAKLPDADDPIITDTEKVVYTLKSLTKEMDTRYDLLKMAHVRNLKEYNEKFLSRRLNPLKGHKYMNYIVVVIDEYADLLMTAGREIEEPIVRLAQLARAVGIHLVIATQRPTANIITGLIKANFPARIAFRVISNIDSRTILETTGANQLVGRGDMLISVNGEITRVQCAFIDTAEVERITEFIGSQHGYPAAHYLPEYTGDDGDQSSVGEVDLGKRDKLFEEAAKLIVQYQQGSTSLIQRRMNLGYNRAGRIMDQLEAAGVVGPSEGSKARQVLVTDFASLDRIIDSLN